MFSPVTNSSLNRGEKTKSEFFIPVSARPPVRIVFLRPPLEAANPIDAPSSRGMRELAALAPTS